MDPKYVTNTAPTSSIQEGIVANCVRWMKAYDVGQGDYCGAFATRAQLTETDFYSLNPFLGANGQNCPNMFWANYWYCIATDKSQPTSAGTTLISITPTPAPAPTPSKGGDSSTTKTSSNAGSPSQSGAQSTAASTTSKPTTTTTQALSIATSPTPSKPSSSSAAASPSANAVYTPNGASYVGCASEIQNGRALPLKPTSDAKMTISMCLASCSSNGYPVAGLEYGRECWCGNALDAGVKLEAGVKGACGMPCAGDQSQTCGGPSLLSVYRNNTLRAASSVSSTGGFDYVGCYDESKGRAVGPLLAAAGGTITIDSCIKTCDGKGLPWAGLEYGQECWCAAKLNEKAPMMKNEACTMQCAGNKGQICGGSNLVSVYKKTSAQKNKRSLGPHATTVGTDGKPTVIKTVKMVRRGRFGRRNAFPA
ncbi:putative WSC domain-containing protein [Seiridium unicorne]|uniref:WSC domain-containing protein n=1 Tax=Seiridium unicorne TaxID=138068 RepID=A0ABR2V828_9PEZI